MRTTLAILSGAIFVACFAGCAKPLLSPDEERTQFDRYDKVRNQHPDQYVYDEFGRRRPNIRGRLLPKG